MNTIVILFNVFLARLYHPPGVQLPPVDGIVEWAHRCHNGSMTEYPEICSVFLESAYELNSKISDWDLLTEEQKEYMSIDYMGLYLYTLP